MHQYPYQHPGESLPWAAKKNPPASAWKRRHQPPCQDRVPCPYRTAEKWTAPPLKSSFLSPPHPAPFSRTPHSYQNNCASALRRLAARCQNAKTRSHALPTLLLFCHTSRGATPYDTDDVYRTARRAHRPVGRCALRLTGAWRHFRHRLGGAGVCLPPQTQHPTHRCDLHHHRRRHLRGYVAGIGWHGLDDSNCRAAAAPPPGPHHDTGAIRHLFSDRHGRHRARRLHPHAHYLRYCTEQRHTA